ncbi:hypothetical protein PB2503_08684 [Parvularcula bermudensis HTCC2503]|uniref:Uncharacterized protein n=1 Tax=Parvularcula bermudensis (strain ATCC BAA-594 / HTCC2503 / KCTC 12087) TaxID=314260 RepID=E0TBZ9_PARBH|nr:hypothetical protein [Parvularcula bermudensis]ADM09792.1 hypothetical protein PB2503_08684 [Parvularcula bermudensis HTCC2503]
MDRQSFIPAAAVFGTTVERKIITLLNSFNDVRDFDVIVDRPGFGRAEEGEGSAIGDTVAQRFLDARPPGGWTTIAEFIRSAWPFRSTISGFGEDKFSDLVYSAIKLSAGDDHRTLTGFFRRISNDGATPFAKIREPVDVLVYGKFAGASDQADFMTVIQVQETDEDGNFSIEDITDDYEEFAIVACFRDDGRVFHRSGLIPIRQFTGDEFRYRPLLLNFSFELLDENFRAQIEEQAGTQLEGGKRLESITSDFKDGFVEIKGRVIAPDTFLWFDSKLDFTIEMRMLPSNMTQDWVRDLTSLVGIQTVVTEQSHQNDGFIIASILAFFVPGGLLLGPIATIVFLAIDSSLDNEASTNELIADAININLDDDQLENIQNAIQDVVENADPITANALRLLSTFDEPPATPEEELEMIIEFMSTHVTIDRTDIDEDKATLSLWLTVPFAIQEV